MGATAGPRDVPEGFPKLHIDQIAIPKALQHMERSPARFVEKAQPQHIAIEEIDPGLRPRLSDRTRRSCPTGPGRRSVPVMSVPLGQAFQWPAVFMSARIDPPSVMRHGL